VDFGAALQDLAIARSERARFGRMALGSRAMAQLRFAQRD